jgi:heme-degrading monooxygenase HmoA
MERTGDFYTVGIWIVKSGNEAAFMDTWKKYSGIAVRDRGAREFLLLQDPVDSKRFLSFGPWESEGSINSWQNQPDFKEFVAQMRSLCDDMQIVFLKSIVQVTPSTVSTRNS